ncbi:hypothetical protein AADG42_18220 [Ammonicoccus fulvus]|uniref:Uncharacterized protein n=1 Tax=Ammonicoccus fulvus TaxID=3138240 RepID=A0ABZ3FX69_9ACTN
MLTGDERSEWETIEYELRRDPDTANDGDLVYAAVWGADDLDRAARRAALQASIRQPTKAELAALMGGDDA